MDEPQLPDQQQAQPRPTRRPPLAEIDTWELWQAWQRGERKIATPWIGLLGGFCLVLAAMYSFFFFTTGLTDDTVARVVLTILFLAFLFVIWQRVSPRREFALVVILSMLVASSLLFFLWFLAYALSGWNPWAAIGGTTVLGLIGLLVGLLSLNAIAKQG